MKKVLLAVGVAMVTAVFVTAQARPDFSGTWVFDAKASAAAGDAAAAGGAAPGGTMSFSGGGRAVMGGGGASGVEYRMTQTAGSLAIERSVGTSTQKFVHTFDGAENVNVNGRTTLRTTSQWDGGRLVTEGTQTVALEGGDVTSTVREVRSLGSDGALVVEVTRTAQGKTTTSKRIYVRKKG